MLIQQVSCEARVHKDIDWQAGGADAQIGGGNEVGGVFGLVRDHGLGNGSHEFVSEQAPISRRTSYSKVINAIIWDDYIRHGAKGRSVEIRRPDIIFQDPGDVRPNIQGNGASKTQGGEAIDIHAGVIAQHAQRS